MYWFCSAALVVLAYLLGSIPSAVWISIGFYGTDVRTLGSSNAGSTNMFRNFGKVAGFATQFLDIGKAVLATLLPLIALKTGIFPDHLMSEWSMEMQKLACGLFAVIGHIYPVFAGFQGGKGINSLLGMMLVVNPLLAGICLVVFVLVLLLSKYVSLSSICAVFSFPLVLILRDVFLGEAVQWGLVSFGIVLFLLVVFTHRSNISRLLNGTESKASFLSSKP